ncbi:hypothetical protein ACQKGC_06265 [Allorhizobium pseudoryzae]|uniref:hypothetical protein n=1 Tax=Allorhizobium pseudoryzae TaxID=379684 RepID=UPI003D03B774
MQRIQAIIPIRLFRDLFVTLLRQRQPSGNPQTGRTNRLHAEEMSNSLRQDLGLTDLHPKRGRFVSQPTAFDAARDVFLRRPL